MSTLKDSASLCAMGKISIFVRERGGGEGGVLDGVVGGPTSTKGTRHEVMRAKERKVEKRGRDRTTIGRESNSENGEKEN